MIVDRLQFSESLKDKVTAVLGSSYKTIAVFMAVYRTK